MSVNELFYTVQIHKPIKFSIYYFMSEQIKNICNSKNQRHYVVVDSRNIRKMFVRRVYSPARIQSRGEIEAEIFLSKGSSTGEKS